MSHCAGKIDTDEECHQFLQMIVNMPITAAAAPNSGAINGKELLRAKFAAKKVKAYLEERFANIPDATPKE